MIAVEKVAAHLGGRKVLRRLVVTEADLDEAVREGIPAASIEFLVREKALSPDEAYETVIPRTTLNRRLKAQGARLSPEESDRAARIARMIATAEDVFADRANAHAWLRSPNPELNDVTPLAASRTEVGARRVESLLTEIAHGIPA
jgi:putative toxin-antitoxin system antitoxin component (TIGR02293 family)